jgi:transporter family-2 protein
MFGNGIALGLVFLAGVAVSLQAPINASLGHASGNTVFAAAASFLIGFVVLVFILTLRGDYPQFHTLKQLPWWMWTGGLLGAYYVWAVLSNVQKVGVLTLVAAVIAGQLITALVIDAIGFDALAKRDVSWQRLASVGLVFGGLLLSRY